MLRYPDRCFTQYEVNIGYYPNRVSREATLRDGPGEQFRVLERLAQSDGFEKLIDDVVARKLDPASAAATILGQDPP